MKPYKKLGSFRVNLYPLKITPYIFLVLFAFSCENSSTGDKENTTRVLAKAGDEDLHLDEFNDNFISTGVAKDSANNAKRSIENWATEALFYQEALTKLNDDEIQIERQVQDYKKSLVNYIYQTKIIEANLDTNISKQEIEAYYNDHRDNFILKENIIKVFYFKVPVKAPALDKMKRLVNSTAPKDVEQLKTLCLQNAENFFTNDSTWLFLDDIKKEIPKLKDQPDFNLTAGKVVDFTDDQYYYHLKVKDIKVKNALSPVNFERQNIKKFIINNRKTQLINTYKKLLFEKAEANKSFVTY